MSLSKDVKKFEKHHAALLIFLTIAGVFLINIFVFSAAYDEVRELQSSGSAPVVIIGPATDGEDEADEQPEEEFQFLAGLKPQIQSVVNNEDVPMAIYVQDLSTEEILGINEKTTFVSASFYKIFVSYEIARLIDLGLIDKTANTGYDADGVTIEECLRRTLSYSDNPCGRALRKLIGADNEPLPSINEAGFISTSLVNDYPTTSAQDVALYFRTLYEAREFPDPINRLLLDPLLEQEINNRLPVPLPDNIEIAHKTADLDGYSHDGGIFYTPGGDYILIVLSGPWANGYSDAPSAHIAISSLVYEWFNGTDSTTTF